MLTCISGHVDVFTDSVNAETCMYHNIYHMTQTVHSALCLVLLYTCCILPIITIGFMYLHNSFLNIILLKKKSFNNYLFNIIISKILY